MPGVDYRPESVEPEVDERMGVESDCQGCCVMIRSGGWLGILQDAQNLGIGRRELVIDV